MDGLQQQKKQKNYIFQRPEPWWDSRGKESSHKALNCQAKF